MHLLCLKQNIMSRLEELLDQRGYYASLSGEEKAKFERSFSIILKNAEKIDDDYRNNAIIEIICGADGIASVCGFEIIKFLDYVVTLWHGHKHLITSYTGKKDFNDFLKNNYQSKKIRTVFARLVSIVAEDIDRDCSVEDYDFLRNWLPQYKNMYPEAYKLVWKKLDELKYFSTFVYDQHNVELLGIYGLDI